MKGVAYICPSPFLPVISSSTSKWENRFHLDDIIGICQAKTKTVSHPYRSNPKAIFWYSAIIKENHSIIYRFLRFIQFLFFNFSLYKLCDFCYKTICFIINKDITAPINESVFNSLYCRITCSNVNLSVTRTQRYDKLICYCSNFILIFIKKICINIPVNFRIRENREIFLRLSNC